MPNANSQAVYPYSRIQITKIILHRGGLELRNRTDTIRQVVRESGLHNQHPAVKRFFPKYDLWKQLEVASKAFLKIDNLGMYLHAELSKHRNWMDVATIEFTACGKPGKIYLRFYGVDNTTIGFAGHVFSTYCPHRSGLWRSSGADITRSLIHEILNGSHRHSSAGVYHYEYLTPSILVPVFSAVTEWL